MGGSSTESETGVLRPSRRWNMARRLAAGVPVVAFMLAAACTMPQRTFQPEQDPAALDDVSFLHYLATIPVVSVDESLRAVLMLARASTGATTYEQRYEALLERGAVKHSWELNADQILSKGTLAYLLRTVCELPRSVDEILASRTGLGERRYALKTCVDEGLLPYSLAHEPVTGGELLSALADAEHYLESRSGKTP